MINDISQAKPAGHGALGDAHLGLKHFDRTEEGKRIVWPVEELKPQLMQVREQKQHWEEEVRGLNQKLGSLKAGAGNLVDAEKLCLSIRERLVNVTPQQKKEFLRLVVERIWVDKSNNLEIEVVIPKLEKQAGDVICEPPSP